jgi:hypothetical protein
LSFPVFQTETERKVDGERLGSDEQRRAPYALARQVRVYETKGSLYVVAVREATSNLGRHIIKIERNEQPGSPLRASVVSRDVSESTVSDALATLASAFRGAGGCRHIVTGDAILGAIRFVSGHYLLIVSKSHVVGSIGQRNIHTIDEVVSIFVPTSSPDPSVYADDDDADHPPTRVVGTAASVFRTLASLDSSIEKRYKDIFSGVDLTRDFYFATDYDLTHSVQYNMTLGCHGVGRTPETEPEGDEPELDLGGDSSSEDEELGPIRHDTRSSSRAYGYDSLYTWNHRLLRPLRRCLDPDLGIVVPVIHGYYVQRMYTSASGDMQITLLARRSRRFAGVRFLKRGVNERGDTGNDVETEQIVINMSHGRSVHDAPVASFIQLRGSIPLFWAQEKRVFEPRPMINLTRRDPFYNAAALHFARLFGRYGCPVTVMNLVKANEKRPREAKVGQELGRCIAELNKTLPARYGIRYVAWDWKAAAKKSVTTLVEHAEEITIESLFRTGFFCSTMPSAQHSEDAANGSGFVTAPSGVRMHASALGSTQRGVMRTNCIDSLDRTNAAHFISGKVLLGLQLYSLGLSSSPALSYSDPAAAVLMDMYEVLGNRVAMQYAGSEAVHTMKTYNKPRGAGNSLSIVGRDFLTNIKRFYSNSFTDAEKQ